MKFYRPDALKVGMKLAKPIYDKRGVLLYDRSSALTESVINSIINFNMIGLFILEPSESLPPITEEERELESLQSSYMFRLRDIVASFSKKTLSPDLDVLATEITEKFGHIDHRYHFGQLLRSADTYTYSHSVCTAILAAMMSRSLSMTKPTTKDMVKAILLCDIGYLYFPENLRDKKPSEWTEKDEEMVLMYRQKGMDLISLEYNEYGFSDITIQILKESMTFSRKEPTELFQKEWHAGTKALIVADKFDRMTATSLGEAPTSSVQAFHYMQERDSIYPTPAVKALSRAILILTVGQCVKLTNGKTAMVMELNKKDAFRPTVMVMETNELLDLYEPRFRDKIEIKAVVDTLDNRYVCDEETLKHFIPDDYLTELLQRLKIGLAKHK